MDRVFLLSSTQIRLFRKPTSYILWTRKIPATIRCACCSPRATSLFSKCRRLRLMRHVGGPENNGKQEPWFLFQCDSLLFQKWAASLYGDFRIEVFKNCFADEMTQPPWLHQMLRYPLSVRALTDSSPFQLSKNSRKPTNVSAWAFRKVIVANAMSFGTTEICAFQKPYCSGSCLSTPLSTLAHYSARPDIKARTCALLPSLYHPLLCTRILKTWQTQCMGFLSLSSKNLENCPHVQFSKLFSVYFKASSR